MVGKIVILVSALVVCYSIVTAKELYELSPIGMKCFLLDPTIVAKYTCKSKNVNRTMNKGIREIIYQPGVILTNMHAKIELFRKFATIYRQFMVSIDQDICELLKNENSPIAKVIDVKGHRKYGTMYDPCPIMGRRYESKVMEYETLPDIIPAGDYRLEVTWYSIIDEKKRNLTRAIMWGSVKTTTAEQWRK